MSHRVARLQAPLPWGLIACLTQISIGLELSIDLFENLQGFWMLEQAFLETDFLLWDTLRSLEFRWTSWIFRLPWPLWSHLLPRVLPGDWVRAFSLLWQKPQVQPQGSSLSFVPLQFSLAKTTFSFPQAVPLNSSDIC